MLPSSRKLQIIHRGKKAEYRRDNKGTENATHEKTTPSKIQFTVMQDMRNGNQTVGVENARHENARHENTRKKKRVHDEHVLVR